MKKVTKDFTNPPAILNSADCVALKASALVQRGHHFFHGDIYGAPEVRIALNNIYNNKCAFCETDPTAGMTIQVEHYRPKAKVTGLKNHPGYYWLGYEWSNLLLACSSCNNKKRSSFPITNENSRVSTPPKDTAEYIITSKKLLDEKAFLLNPEIIKDPRIHFSYESNGKIVPIGVEAENTIEKLGLNRGALIIARKKVLDKCINNILLSYQDYLAGVSNLGELEYGVFVRIRDLVSTWVSNEPYSEFARYCWEHFNEFVVNMLINPLQTIVGEVFIRFKSQLLK